MKLIKKGLVGIKIPTYFSKYGINADKLYGMFTALVNKGLGVYPSLMYAWQAIKEQPKKYYAFGKSYNDVESWALHAYDSLTGKRSHGLYKSAQNATDYNSYRKAMKSFNSSANYWNTWLPTGLKDAETYLKSRYASDLEKHIVVPFSQETSSENSEQNPQETILVLTNKVGGRLIPKNQTAGKVGYHQERDINGNWRWVKNGNVGTEGNQSIAITPSSGTTSTSAKTRAKLAYTNRTQTVSAKRKEIADLKAEAAVTNRNKQLSRGTDAYKISAADEAQRVNQEVAKATASEPLALQLHDAARNVLPGYAFGTALSHAIHGEGDLAAEDVTKGVGTTGWLFGPVGTATSTAAWTAQGANNILNGNRAQGVLDVGLALAPYANTVYNTLKPVVSSAAKTAGNTVSKINLFSISPYTGNWTTFGNYQYRLKPNMVYSGIPAVERLAVSDRLAEQADEALTKGLDITSPFTYNSNNRDVLEQMLRKIAGGVDMNYSEIGGEPSLQTAVNVMARDKNNEFTNGAIVINRGTHSSKSYPAFSAIASAQKGLASRAGILMGASNPRVALYYTDVGKPSYKQNFINQIQSSNVSLDAKKLAYDLVEELDNLVVRGPRENSIGFASVSENPKILELVDKINFWLGNPTEQGAAGFSTGANQLVRTNKNAVGTINGRGLEFSNIKISPSQLKLPGSGLSVSKNSKGDTRTISGTDDIAKNMKIETITFPSGKKIQVPYVLNVQNVLDPYLTNVIMYRAPKPGSWGPLFLYNSMKNGGTINKHKKYFS